MAFEKEIDIVVNTEKAVQNTEKLIDSVGDLSKEVSESNKDTAKGLKGVEGAAKSTANGVKAIGTSLKALGIGVVIALFAKLREVFESNQKVADAFANVAETISLVFNELVNTTLQVYDAVSKSTGGFDALGKVLGGILKIAITPLKVGFFGIKLGIQEAQLIWEKSFFGDKNQNVIDELNAGILETKLALVETGEEAIKAGKDIGKNIVEAIGEVTEFTVSAIDSISKISVKGAYESAQAIVQLKKSAEIAAAVQSGLVEENDRLAEKQRQIRDDDLRGISERIKANDQLLVVLTKQREDMQKQAKLQTAAASADFNKNQSTENYIALIEAQNNEKAIEAQIEGFLSEQLVNKNALIKEGNDLKTSGLETDIEIRKKQAEFDAEQEENELLKLEKQKENLENQAQIDLDELERKRLLYKEDTQARVDAENEYLLLKQDIDNALTLNEKETSKERQIISDAEAETKKQNLDNTSQLLQNFTAIAGEQTAIGKGLAVASATINTYRGVSDALAATTVTPFETALKFANAIAIGVTGLANVKKILSTKVPSVKGAGGGSGGGGGTSAPSFNLVAGTGSNQIAEGLNNQSQPLKTYVVSSDVSTSQELDRKIIQGASLG